MCLFFLFLSLLFFWMVWYNMLWLNGFQAAKSNSIPVKLLGYKTLVENGQSANSESLPDLKWNGNRSSHYLRTIRREPAVCHSFSDPDIVRSARPKDKYLRKNQSKRILPLALIERLQMADASSNSDCSELSGWISSTASSRIHSPLLEEELYPESAPLAPPEEFQVRLPAPLFTTWDPFLFYFFELCNDQVGMIGGSITKSTDILCVPVHSVVVKCCSQDQRWTRVNFVLFIYSRQDPPRSNYFAGSFSFNSSKMTSPKHQVPTEGTRGTYRSVGDDTGNQSIENRTKGRPLSHEV